MREQPSLLARLTNVMRKTHVILLRAVLLVPLLYTFSAGKAEGLLQEQREQSDTKMAAIEEGRNALMIPSFDAAREAFHRASRIDPDDPIPHIWLARCDFLQPPDRFDHESRLIRALDELEDALRLDPDNREARYWKGRVLTRLGRARNWAEAKELYNGLVEEDPHYQDVMRRLLEAHVNHGTLPAYIAELENSARSNLDDPVLTYRYAEALRQSGSLGRAEAMLRGLQRRFLDFSPGWVNYSLALTMFEQEQYEVGTDFYLDAVTFMNNPSVAGAMWEDCYMIANLVEMSRYRRAETVEDFRDFFRAFWKSRDPTKSTVDNERIGVHYERLQVATRHYLLSGVRAPWNDPDKDGLLRFPPTYDVESPFNDMGIVYIRHGEPDDTAHFHDVPVENMSWKYEAKGQRPEMIVHFEQHSLGGGWRFVAAPGPGEYALSRTSLDPKFGALVRGADIQSLSWLLADANNDLQEALTQDTYVPEIDAIPLTVFNDEASFKSVEGRSRYEAYWAIPVGELLSPAVLERGEALINVNITLFTMDFREVYKNERTFPLPLPPGTDPGNITIDQEVMAVPPGRYTMVLHITEELGKAMQIQEIPVVVRAFPEGELSISDVEIASRIEEGEIGYFAKSGYTVIPLPTRVYQAGQPVLIYFDIYGLAKDEYGATRYRISYRLEPGGGEQGSIGRVTIGGRQGRRQETGGVEVILEEESGILNDVHRRLAIDLEESSFRTYRLMVTVEDLVAETRAVQRTFFHVNIRE